jgi:N-acetylneuraminic acid mutarotase
LAIPLWSANPPITVTPVMWERLPDMPEGKWGHASVGCDSRIYVAGGGDDQGKHSATMFAFDLATNQWSKCADAPTARQSEVLAAVNGKVYWIGGHDSTLGEKGGKTNICAMYDPPTDQWTVMSPMPTAREDMGGVVVGDEIWIWGGVDNRGHAVTQAVEVYDTVTDSWRTACQWLTPHCLGHVACACGSVTFLLAGVETMLGYPALQPSHQVQLYIDGLFISLADLPYGHAYTDPVFLNGIIYVMGGCNIGAYDPTDRVDRFSVIDNCWLEPQVMPYAGSGLAVCEHQGSIYVSGGGIEKKATPYFYRFVPLTPAEQDQPADREDGESRPDIDGLLQR